MLCLYSTLKSDKLEVIKRSKLWEKEFIIKGLFKWGWGWCVLKIMYPSHLIQVVLSHNFTTFWLHNSCHLTYVPYFFIFLVNWNELLLEKNCKLSKTCYWWVTDRSRELQILDISTERVIVQMKVQKARVWQFFLTFGMIYKWKRMKVTLLGYFFSRYS